MSLLQKIRSALDDIADYENQMPTQGKIPIGEGAYPEAEGMCAKIVYTGQDKPLFFFGKQLPVEVETFKVFVRGVNYAALEEKSKDIKRALSAAGFIQSGGFEDIEHNENETLMQLAVSYKAVINEIE